jgi:NAD+ synthetase
MAGGLAVISDVPKGLVYSLCRHLNRDGEKIPDRVLTKAPSAELRPDQRDEDSLPPYEVLDAILEGHIEKGMGIPALVEAGLPAGIVTRVVAMVAGAEYKRRQAAPGIRISPKAFGPGRRMPIATGWPPSGTG